MKILELVTKLERLNMSQIDELVENGIEIEDIQYILLHNEENIQEKLFKNEKLKQAILKEIDRYILSLFEDLKNDSNFTLSNNLKKICETYLKDYFKQAIEFNIEKGMGRKIATIVVELSKKNPDISELYKEVRVWEKYCNGMRNISKKDMGNMQKEHLLEYDKMFKDFFERIISGYNVQEAEAILNVLKRSDIDLTELVSLDEFSKQYENQSKNLRNRIIRTDEVFSIILDYDILLKNKGIEKNNQYSAIKEMEQTILDGKFGINNNLSGKEFAFALKMLQNPEILNPEMTQKLEEILKNPDLKLVVGSRELLQFLEKPETYKKAIETFPNLKNNMLKQINLMLTALFKKFNNKGNQELSEDAKNISESYFRNYFEEGIDLDITNENGRNLFREIMIARERSSFIIEQFQTNKIFIKYRNSVYKMINKDLENLSAEEMMEYDKTLKFHFSNVVMGYAIPEYEAALKLVQMKDIDITKLESLDYLCERYANEKVKPGSRMIESDKIFSVILDYDILLKNKGIVKKGQYSPIKEMEQAILDGKFGENNNLQKEETAFVLKILQNPGILNDEVNSKLIQILNNTEIQLNIGTKEMRELLQDKQKFNQICEVCPNLEDKILKQMNIYIVSILKDIYEKQRNIVLQEKESYTQYLKNYFELALDKGRDMLEMSELFCLANDLSHPDVYYNIRKLKNKKETVDFLKDEFENNEVHPKYTQQMIKISNTLKMDESITKELFKYYDNIFYEFRFKIENKEEASIFQAIEEVSGKLKMPSKSIEDQIDIHLERCIEGLEVPEQEEFYEMIRQYYERQLQGTALEINQNGTICHMIRAAQKGMLPENISNWILASLEERKNKSVNFQISDSIEDMESIAEIRLQHGRIPREYCESIIKQAILQKKQMIKYSRMIERVLEDFTEYELEDSKINSYYISVVNQHLFNDGDTVGEQNSSVKTIKISRQRYQMMGVFKILETVLHESTHAEQADQIANQQVNRETYKMLKEKILRKENDEFYDDNYLHMYSEIDARKNGYIKRLQRLRKIGLSDSQIMELQTSDVKQTISEYLKYYEEGKVKKVGTENKDVNTTFFEILQEKSELLEEYPILSIEFEKNGDSVRRKSFVKILKSYEQTLNSVNNIKEKQRMSGLYAEVLLNSGPINEANIEKELNELIEFQSDNSIISAYKNKILTTIFPKEMVSMLTMRKMYENTSEEQRKKLQKELQQELQNRKKFIQNEDKNK